MSFSPSRRPGFVLPVAALLITLALAVPSAEAQIAPVRLEPLPPIGCLVCEGPRAFGRVDWLAALPDGGLVALDRDPPVVRIFAPDGTVRAAFGRKGEGPGEFLTPSGVAVLGDRIVVADIRRPVLSELTLDGRYVRGVSAEQTVGDLQGSPDGKWAVYQEARWTTMSAAVYLLTPGSDSAQPVLHDTENVVEDEEGQAASVGTFSSAPGPGGVVAVGHGGVYRITVLDRSGKRLREIRRDIPRARRTEAEVEEIRERVDQARARLGRNPEGQGRPPEVDPLRMHFRPGALAFDEGGRMWVRTERGGPAATTFDLFDPSGAFLGEVRLQVRLHAFTLGPKMLAGVVRDPETGTDALHRWVVR